MTRSARLAVGCVLCFVLVLVAGVSALVAAVAGAQSDDAWFGAVAEEGGFFVDPVAAEAVVLDVDGAGEGWLSVDVEFTTEDGEVEVGYVDLGEEATASVPQVGDTLDVLYERGQPQSVLRADDPVLSGEPAPDDPSVAPLEDRAAVAAALVRRVSVLAVGSLLAALLVAGLTVLAVRRAPAEVVLPTTTQA